MTEKMELLLQLIVSLFQLLKPGISTELIPVGEHPGETVSSVMGGYEWHGDWSEKLAVSLSKHLECC